MKLAYFISDAHLGAGYITDKREHECRLVRFLDSIKADAAELYLLGDILDYWFEYKHVVPRGHVRFLGKLAELADAGVKIYWFTGNHDVWLRDYLSSEIGLKVIYGHTPMTVLGKQFLLSHGDDVGYQRPGYRVIRSIFYNKVCQWLYASVHPRWTYPLATRWSQRNRVTRDKDTETRLKQEFCKHLEDYCNSYSASHPDVEHFVFGHLHLACQVKLHQGRDMTVLGDWIDQMTYATFDGKNVELRSYNEVGS